MPTIKIGKRRYQVSLVKDDKVAIRDISRKVTLYVPASGGYMDSAACVRQWLGILRIERERLIAKGQSVPREMNKLLE